MPRPTMSVEMNVPTMANSAIEPKLAKNEFLWSE